MSSRTAFMQVLRNVEPVRRFVTAIDKKLPAGRVAVIGSGPAAFYCLQSLFRRWDTCTVDMFEKLPVPYGLVRFGVAPDHPEVKNCINQFERTIEENYDRFKFYGNVDIGNDIKMKDLIENYHIVVLAYGAESDKRLGISGEQAENCFSARTFVGWYNGHPNMANLKIDLTTTDTAVVFGHGNVALDVARILLLPVDILAKTDITEYSLEALKKSKINRVVLIGRRGPLQVSFTIAELREMIKLPGSRPVFDKADFSKFDKQFIELLERPRRRLTQLMVDTALSPPVKTTKDDAKNWELKFLRSPLEIVTSVTSNKVEGVKLVKNVLTETEPASFLKAKALPTNEHESLTCGLVLFSIGYQTVNVDHSLLPFDSKAHVLRTDDLSLTKVQGLPGVYACGWCSKGPVGVLATTQSHAKAVAERIVSDANSQAIDLTTEKHGSFATEPILIKKGIPWVTWENWKKIDELEQECGKFVGKPRQKIVDKQEFFKHASSLKV